MTGQDDLIRRAQARADSAGVPSEWGEILELDEGGGVFIGRYRGRATDDKYDPARPVFLLWDDDNEPRYMRGRYRLVQEFDRVNPDVGDTVAIYRGEDYVTQAGNSGHNYGVEKQANREPLPGPAEQTAAGVDDELPF